MIIIAHRANIAGPCASTENKPEQIDICIRNGFDVEIDIRLHKGVLMLGHDSPWYPVDLSWLREREMYLWVHCKDIEALWLLKDTRLNCFSHDLDPCVLTSKKDIWVYPGKHLVTGSIAVMPEGVYSGEALSVCKGICTDYPENYEKTLSSGT